MKPCSNPKGVLRYHSVKSGPLWYVMLTPVAVRVGEGASVVQRFVPHLRRLMEYCHAPAGSVNRGPFLVKASSMPWTVFVAVKPGCAFVRLKVEGSSS